MLSKQMQAGGSAPSQNLRWSAAKHQQGERRWTLLLTGFRKSLSNPSIIQKQLHSLNPLTTASFHLNLSGSADAPKVISDYLGEQLNQWWLEFVSHRRRRTKASNTASDISANETQIMICLSVSKSSFQLTPSNIITVVQLLSIINACPDGQVDMNSGLQTICLKG